MGALDSGSGHVLSFCGPLPCTEWYEDLFDNYLGEKSWEIHSKGIYVGPWRVPTLVELTPEQMVWYKMQDESIPHVSLGLHVEHQAKDLGPMVRMAGKSIDWVFTQILGVTCCSRCKTYWTDLEALDMVLLVNPNPNPESAEFMEEKKKGSSKALRALAALPNSLWCQGPTDVGLTDCALLNFELTQYTPISLQKSRILNHTKPLRVKDMLSFWGLTGYSRHYIPDCMGLTQPLCDLVKEQVMRNPTGKLNWIVEAEQDFITLKQALSKAEDLAVPDYNRDFFLDVSKTKGVVS